jgi:hypothetical protein
MNWVYREPTLNEILSDSIVRALMEAEGIDPQELATTLRQAGRKLGQRDVRLAQIKNGFVRWRLSAFMRFCSASGIAPAEVDEVVLEHFLRYRAQSGTVSGDASGRRLARVGIRMSEICRVGRRVGSGSQR